MTKQLPDNFYEKIKPRLHERIGREVSLARRILDLGCGSCDLVGYLVSAYHQQVTGVDVSGSSFPPRRHTPDGSPFHCLKRDAASMSFVDDGSADAVVAMWALHEMAKPQAILREAYRALRPGGEMVIVEFPKGSLAQKLWNEAYFTLDEIEDMLTRAAFANVRGKLIEKRQIAWATALKPTRLDIVAKANSGLDEHGASKAGKG